MMVLFYCKSQWGDCKGSMVGLVIHKNIMVDELKGSLKYLPEVDCVRFESVEDMV